ncbi:hypothetical protein C1H46_027187 [Malus baccata]|uniref:Uncharacterized protein n=1 Tax=Malus baccata TaxID=106549 RepID=A0A540LLB0_MALBA|nr:hypothetical protein C1H46_027187 [Malus baccata]
MPTRMVETTNPLTHLGSDKQQRPEGRVPPTIDQIWETLMKINAFITFLVEIKNLDPESFEDQERCRPLNRNNLKDASSDAQNQLLSRVVPKISKVFAIHLYPIIWFSGYPNNFVVPIHEIIYDIETLSQSGVVILHFVQLLERGKWTSMTCLNAIVQQRLYVGHYLLWEEGMLGSMLSILRTTDTSDSGLSRLTEVHPPNRATVQLQQASKPECLYKQAVAEKMILKPSRVVKLEK